MFFCPNTPLETQWLKMVVLVWHLESTLFKDGESMAMELYILENILSLIQEAS